LSVTIDGNTYRDLTRSDAEVLIEYAMVASEQTRKKPVVASQPESKALRLAVCTIP
jgi:hypothetical protein